MLEMKYIGEDAVHQVSFRTVSGNVCELTGDFPVNSGGFTLSRSGANDDWDYSRYKTIYRKIKSGAQFSNDSSVFVPHVTFLAGYGGILNGETVQETYNYEDLEIPAPVPAENHVFAGWEPEIPESGEILDHQTFRALFQYVPTLEEIKAEKINELQASGSAAVSSGVEYEGTKYPCDAGLKDSAENAITTGKTVIMKDEDGMPHTLKPASMKALYATQERNRVEAQEYTARLIEYAKSLSSKEEVNAITYGADLPESQREEYEQTVEARMSVVNAALDMIEAQSKQAKINAESNTNEQAYSVAALYDYWPDIPEGTMLAEGKIVLHSNGILYRVNEGQGHQKQSTWAPDTAVSLFTPIPKEGEDGTFENPISWVQGMESEEGKYYISNGIKYLCIESSGIGLWGDPADLARYFQVAQ